MDITEVEREDMGWIKVANDRVQSKDFENTTVKPRVA